jgi:hypothetical protein
MPPTLKGHALQDRGSDSVADVAYRPLEDDRDHDAIDRRHDCYYCRQEARIGNIQLTPGRSGIERSVTQGPLLFGPLLLNCVLTPSKVGTVYESTDHSLQFLVGGKKLVHHFSQYSIYDDDDDWSLVVVVAVVVAIIRTLILLLVVVLGGIHGLDFTTVPLKRHF